MSSNALAQVPDGYEIRQLQPEHLEWVKAVVGHAMAFDSPIWAVELPEGQTQRAYELAEANDASARHCIASGLSYGVFIKDWSLKYADSDQGGELRWNKEDTKASREELLELMDFPLVSVALSQDVAKSKPPPDPSAPPSRSFGEILDGHEAIRDNLAAENNAKGIAWKPPKTEKGEGKVVKRSGTCTRGDHASKGLAKALAHFVMHKMAEQGYQAIQIDAGSDAVARVWEHPPWPYRADVVSVFDTSTHPKFKKATVVNKRIWVTLREKTAEEKALAASME
jgi:hypothetical protein